MKNNGLFSSLFIEELKDSVKLDDAALGRMATLAQVWRTHERQDAISLWETFLKQALSYLEFVPPTDPDAPNIYPLYEDYSFSNCIAVLYFVEPGSDIEDTAVGRFYPAKLIAQLRKRKLNWGILTDGARWRLYSTKSSRPYEDFVELPLANTLENNDGAEYGLFERFFHKDSFITEETEGTEDKQQDESAGIYKCRLDHDRDQSEQVLEEWVKKPFLKQVDEVLQYICNGFIFDTKKSGDEYTEEERAEIFESAVKLIYRCLFLFYAEARRLLPSDPEKADLYRRHSIQALCGEARKFRWGQRRDTDQYDLWKHLKGLVNAVNDGDPEYGIMGYNGGLFDDGEERFLGQHQLRNDFLYPALYLLAFVEPYDNEPDEEYAIPYEDLEVRHLGELYETILEYTVQLADADRIRRRTKKGVEMLLASQTIKKAGDTLIKKGDVCFAESALERKQTGSYYTAESLVRFLNEKTIVQPLRETFEQEHRRRFNEFLEQARNGHDAGTRRGAAQSAAALVERFVEGEVLNFKVCDPAMGSGHFLVDAANQMAGLVVALLEEVPHVEGMTVSVTSRPNDWRRRITRHCIYGVDLNPLAVNLAKLSLWLNCFAIEHKLTFLDHHVRCGNSLIGIRSLNQLASIPERKKGRKKTKQPDAGDLFPNYSEYATILNDVAGNIHSISAVDEDDTDQQKTIFDEVGKKISTFRPLADLYTSYLMDSSIQRDDYHTLFYRIANKQEPLDPLNPALPEILESAGAYRDWHHFYHWPLEFPAVFGPDAVGGFSATVGNPPWDLSSANPQEFFSVYDSQFRSLNRKQSLIRLKAICDQNESIADKWSLYQRGIAEQNLYFGEPSAYTSAPSGRNNIYQYFLLRGFDILNADGHLGLVIPSGFYTDKGCQPLRELFFGHSRIGFLYCFENRWPTVFSAVDGRFKFVTFGTKKGGKTDGFKCAFMMHDPERLQAIENTALEMRMDYIRKFSPDTWALMEFNSPRQLNISAALYSDSILLSDFTYGGQHIEFQLELMMNTAAKLFIDAKHLGSQTCDSNSTYLPLFEGKMIWQYDAQWGPPQYYVDEHLTHDYIGYPTPFFRLGFRDVTASTNERTLVATIIPPTYHGNSVPTIVAKQNIGASPPEVTTDTSFLLSVLNSFCSDFIARQKITNHMNFHFMRSLPIPRVKHPFIRMHISARVARLVCTDKLLAGLWSESFDQSFAQFELWDYCTTYGPAHEQEIRRRLRDEAKNLTPEWGPHCGVHDRLPDRRDTGDRAQLRAEIDAYVAHLYGLSRDDFAYILDTFPVLKKKEEKAFGEFMSKRKCLEEYDRIEIIMNAEG